MILPKSTLLALLPFFLATPSLAVSGNGKTTRYWDCCKPSCAWSGKASFSTGPVETCDKNNNVLTDVNAKSGCENGGSAFMCGDQTPWAVSDSLAYGFAAVSIAGGTEASWCCACYELTFTSGPVAGKKMIVQATNTGGDLGSNHFDINMPGGGFGIFNGCTPQYGTPSTGWGEQYGGISSRSQCDAFPAALKAGCYWRFDWFKNADNPAVSFKSVACPRALTNKTGCVRSDDSPIGDANVPTAGANVPTAGVNVPASSSKVPAASSKVPTASSKVPTPDANVPTPDANVPTPDANVPTPDANVPTAGANVPTAVTNVPSAGGSVPTVGGGGGSCQMPGTGATVAKYGQCGGKGYTGATTCAAGSTCKESNPWYSQCL